MSRYPLEGYREKCNTSVILGNRFAKKPLHLDIPITIAGRALVHLEQMQRMHWEEELLKWELLQPLVWRDDQRRKGF